MNRQVSEVIEGSLRVLEKLNQYEFAVELRLMRDGLNENNWDFRNLEEYYSTFAGKPILIAYVGAEIGDGHNADTKIDLETGKKYRSYMSPTAERIVGTISEDINDLALVEEDGYTWIVAKGKLWQIYAPELVEKIVRTGRMDVSVETNVKEMRTRGDAEIFTVWDALGVTILGDNVPPAIPGANISAYMDSTFEDEFKEMKLKVASLLEDKPQKKTTKKEGERNMSSEQNMANAIETKFPQYKVVNREMDEKYICLLEKSSGNVFVYDSDKISLEDLKVTDFMPATLSAKFAEDCNVDIEIGTFHAELARNLETISENLAETGAKLSKFMEKEKSRRSMQAKEAAKAELENINEFKTENEKIDEACIESIIADAENGEFSECEDVDGNWCGDEKARSAVRDAAMLEQMKIDAKRAENNNANKHYGFEMRENSKRKDENSIEGIYARMTN